MTVGVVGTLAFLALGVTAVVTLLRLRSRLQDVASRDLALGLVAAVCAGFSCLFMFDAFAFPDDHGDAVPRVGRRWRASSHGKGGPPNERTGMTSLLDVASVVVTFNSQSHVAQLLDSIPDAMGDLSFSVTVVDNGSTDATLDLLASRADCQVVRSTNDGYAAGLNRGVRASPAARAVLVLNPDAVLDPGCVPAMLRVLDRPGVGIVAPRVREEDGRLSPTLRRGPTMGRVGGLSFTGLKCFTERIEDPGGVRARARGRLGGRERFC